MNDPIVINGMDITKEVEEAFHRQWVRDAFAAQARQIDAATARRHLSMAAVAGDVDPVAHVDPFWFHYWGRREGYEIWSDRKEIERFKRDTPEMRPQVERRKRFAGHRFAEGKSDVEKASKGDDEGLLDRCGRPLAMAG